MHQLCRYNHNRLSGKICLFVFILHGRIIKTFIKAIFSKDWARRLKQLLFFLNVYLFSFYLGNRQKSFTIGSLQKCLPGLSSIQVPRAFQRPQCFSHHLLPSRVPASRKLEAKVEMKLHLDTWMWDNRVPDNVLTEHLPQTTAFKVHWMKAARLELSEHGVTHQ